jgi:hypothetical protein
MAALRFLALIPLWAEALGAISIPAKMRAWREAQVEEVLVVGHEQVVQALLDRAMRAVQDMAPNMLAVVAEALVLLAPQPLRIQAAMVALALQAA